uniref:Uncharacterized protein n=1 Tax=Panagrolaimus sp. ES5 TaxID=591445 RepID=A0AC34F977_9BILA
MPKTVTVSLHDSQTSILPLPSELELDDYIYFILTNTTTKWKKNLQLNENKQWKYTVLKDVTTSMFVLDEKYPRNAVIFNVGEKRNCIALFKLNFHVPSKCQVKFSYKNQRLKLITDIDEKILNGQTFKLYFHEGRLLGIQMTPFKIIELNVCEIETTPAHAWLIHDVEAATCENTSFTFDSNVKIAVSNSKKSLPKTWKPYKSSKNFETTTSATKNKDVSLTWLWIILGIIFALILIGFSLMIFYNYCCSRKKSKTPSDELAKQYELHKRKIKAKKRLKKELSITEPVE